MQSEEGGIVTSLPVLFENVVVETLLALKEIVIVKLVDEGEGVTGEVHSRDNKELRDSTVGHFQGLWEVKPLHCECFGQQKRCKFLGLCVTLRYVFLFLLMAYLNYCTNLV